MSTIFANVPGPIFLISNKITTMNKAAFNISCQVPKSIPNFLDIATFINVHGSVPRSTSMRNERKKPIHSTPTSIKTSFLKNAGWCVYTYIFSFISRGNPLTCGFCWDDEVYAVLLPRSDGYAHE